MYQSKYVRTSLQDLKSLLKVTENTWEVLGKEIASLIQERERTHPKDPHFKKLHQRQAYISACIPKLCEKYGSQFKCESKDVEEVLNEVLHKKIKNRMLTVARSAGLYARGSNRKDAHVPFPHLNGKSNLASQSISQRSTDRDVSRLATSAQPGNEQPRDVTSIALLTLPIPTPRTSSRRLFMSKRAQENREQMKAHISPATRTRRPVVRVVEKGIQSSSLPTNTTPPEGFYNSDDRNTPYKEPIGKLCLQITFESTRRSAKVQAAKSPVRSNPLVDYSDDSDESVSSTRSTVVVRPKQDLASDSLLQSFVNKPGRKDAHTYSFTEIIEQRMFHLWLSRVPTLDEFRKGACWKGGVVPSDGSRISVVKIRSNVMPNEWIEVDMKAKTKFEELLTSNLIRRPGQVFDGYITATLRPQ